MNSNDFLPIPLLSNPHCQTLLARLGGGKSPGAARHETVAVSSGDKVAAVVNLPKRWRAPDRTVVLVHGLCGCFLSPYMVRVARRLVVCGFRVVRMNLRGCGSGAGLARLPYHSGQSEDVRCLIQHLGPSSPITLVGFSLGGNIALRLAGEDGPAPTGALDSVIALSAPIDLDKCCRLLEARSNRIYQDYFLNSLLKDVRNRERFFPDLEWTDLTPVKTIRDFDDVYTSVRSGFRDSAEYYSRCSALPVIDGIRIPALLVSARDDPFISPEPYDGVADSHWVTKALPQHGGHLGFLGRTGTALDFRWMDKLIADWISSLALAAPG